MKARHIIIAVMLLCGITKGLAGSKNFWGYGSLALEVGVWKPSAIDPHPSKPFANLEGADPLTGVSVVSPTLWGCAIQLSTLHWQQKITTPEADLSIYLRQIQIDFKHPLVSHSRISPFVTYGVILFWSKQSQNDLSSEQVKFAYEGLGANVATGVDFALSRHFGIAAEYQYIYAEFREKIGLTSHYSGPKLAAKLLIFF